MFLIYWDDVLVGFNSMLNMPSGTLKNAFREHRLVVLPDFQGLGFGTRISEFIGEYLLQRGYKYFSRSTHIRLGRHRSNSPLWCATATNQKLRSTLNEDNANTTQGSKYKKLDDKRVAYSFEYVGEDYNKKEHQIIVCNGYISKDKANQMLDIIINKSKFPIIVSGIASVKEITVWEDIAKKRGIRHEVLKIKKKGELFRNNSAIGDENFDVILPNKIDREIIEDIKSRLSTVITCYDSDENQYYKWNSTDKKAVQILNKGDKMIKNEYYTGIGSRNTPQFIMEIQSQVASMLAKKGYIVSKDIDKSIKFVICYTNEDVSNTIRIADDLNIPIFDCGKYDDAESLKTSLILFLQNVLDN